MNKNYITQTTLADGQIAIFYLGQVGFLIKYKDTYTVIDAYLSDYVDKNCSNDIVKWVRNYPAPIDALELDFVDYVFCTHGHSDHADPETLGKIASVNPKAKFYMSAAITDKIESYGISKDRIIALGCDSVYHISDDIKVTPVPAAHEVLHCDENGNYLEVGFRFEFGDTVVFHGGDGCPYDGLEQRLDGCDVLMLPVNGRDYYRTNVMNIIGCFNAIEAATIAKNVGADLLIPTHFDLYDVNCISASEFTEKLYKVNPCQKFHIFAPGERFVYVK